MNRLSPYQRIKLVNLIRRENDTSVTNAYDLLEEFDFDNIKQSAKLIGLKAEEVETIVNEKYE